MTTKRRRASVAPQPYVPNSVPLSVRLQLAVLAAGLLLYICAGLAVGHVYLPTKRGGVLLGGSGTLVIVLGVAVLLMAVLLKIVDHYDRRPNEATYVALRAWLLKAAVVLLFAGPLFAMLLGLLGIDPARGFQGLAHHVTWHSPVMREYAPRLRLLLDQSIWIGAVSMLALCMGLLIGKLAPSRRRLVVLFAAVALLGFGLLILGYTLEDFLLGEVEIRRRGTISATQKPNIFNAVLLTRGLAGALLFGAGVALGWMAVRRRGIA